MKTVQAYRFALDPTPRRVAVLRRTPGRRGSRTTGRSRRVKAVDGPARRGGDLRRYRRRTSRRAWRGRCRRCVRRGTRPRATSRRGGRSAPRRRSTPAWTQPGPGLENWRDSRSGKREGRAGRLPAFQDQAAGDAESCRFTTGAIRVEPDRKHVVLPRLGRSKLHESARKLARRLEAGTARILSATVKLDGGRWYVSFYLRGRAGRPRAPRPAGRVVGVDVGIKHLAVLSTGELVANPRHLARRAPSDCGGSPRRAVPPGRPGPAHRRRSRRTAGSGRADRSAGRTPGWRTCAATACTSSPPGWPASTARSWWKTCNVAGMLRNRRLARPSPTAGSPTLRRQLAYKTGWNGGRLRRGRPLVSRPPRPARAAAR